MKKLAILAILAMSSVGISACSEQKSSSSGEVIAEVNGTDITKTELEKVLAQFTGLPNAQLGDYPEDFQKELLNKYIEKKLLVEAARDAGLQKDDKIQAQLKEAEEFLIEQKMLEKIVADESSDEKLQALYDELVEPRKGEQEVMAAHILVKTEEEAKKVKAKLKAGQKFEKLAGEFSVDAGTKINGGDLGYFTADKMIPEFSDKAFAMKKGEVSEPIQTAFGWHIIKVDDKRELEIPEFAQAKPALKKELARRAVEAKVAELRETAKIEIEKGFPIAQKAVSKPTIEDNLQEAEEPAAGEEIK
jgi:peptidyl-prolyl cis-trans isomerase C